MIMDHKSHGKLTSEGHCVLMKSRIIQFVDILAKYLEAIGITSLRAEKEMNCEEGDAFLFFPSAEEVIFHSVHIVVMLDGVPRPKYAQNAAKA
jgi:hypothetical protein